MDVINCKLFMIPKLMKKHIYLLLFLTGALFRVLAPDLLKFFINYNDSNNNDLKHQLTNKYIEIIRNVISALLLGIPHLLNRMKNKDSNYKDRKQQTYNTNSQKVYFIYNSENNESSRIPIMLKIILIISSVDIICQLLIPLKYIIDKIKFNKIVNIDQSHLYVLLFFDIFARYIFSRWILKTYFYFHHKLSFILTIIGLIPIGTIDIMNKIIGNNINNYNYNYIYILVVSLQLILYSFEDIMNKVAFRALSILPYTLIFYNGLFQLGYLVIISILFFSLNLYDFKNGDDFQHFNLRYEIQYFICFIPFNIMRNYYLVKIIDTFSAQYMALLRVTEAIIIFIYNKISQHIHLTEPHFEITYQEYIIQCVGFFILLISTLIHNEIIIINNSKLKSKTQYFLDKDADKEQDCSINSDTYFSDTCTLSVTNPENDLTGSDLS